jgi:hypothetical protein
MQNIVHQIRSKGDSSFEHIDYVSPYLEHAYLYGVSEQCVGKAVKTHLPYKSAPKSHAKYIYVYREGRDVALSYYHHFVNVHGFGEPPEKFVEMFLSGEVVGNWFDHLAGWFGNKERLDIIYVGYHELKLDLAGQVARISKFLCIELSHKEIDTITGLCSFEYMKSHEYKFRLGRGVIPPSKPIARSNSFVRAGREGDGLSFMGDHATRKYLYLARRDLPAHVLRLLGI